jgi:hypothetical protein
MASIPWAEVIIVLWCILVLAGAGYCGVKRYRFVNGR